MTRTVAQSVATGSEHRSEIQIGIDARGGEMMLARYVCEVRVSEKKRRCRYVSDSLVGRLVGNEGEPKVGRNIKGDTRTFSRRETWVARWAPNLH